MKGTKKCENCGDPIPDDMTICSKCESIRERMTELYENFEEDNTDEIIPDFLLKKFNVE